MKIITEEHISAAIDKIDNLSEKDINSFIDKFKEAQPALFVFLLAVGEEELSDEENEMLFFSGMLIWYATVLAEANVPPVSEQTLDEIDSHNMEFMDSLSASEDDDTFTVNVESMVKEHRQSELLEFALITTMDDEGIDEDSKGLIFIHLKTFIEALDKQGSLSA